MNYITQLADIIARCPKWDLEMLTRLLPQEVHLNFSTSTVHVDSQYYSTIRLKISHESDSIILNLVCGARPGTDIHLISSYSHGHLGIGIWTTELSSFRSSISSKKSSMFYEADCWSYPAKDLIMEAIKIRTKLKLLQRALT